MSWFASATSASGPNFHPVQLSLEQDAAFGPLVDADLEWLAQGSGFVTETQTFYATTPAGGYLMIQVIHSSVGVWYPSIQFTFRYVEPSKNIHVWKSSSVSNFTVAPKAASGQQLDRRSAKADNFSISVDPANPTRYTIEGKHDDDVVIAVTFDRLSAGWKAGAGPKGGMSYFGQFPDGGLKVDPSARAGPETAKGNSLDGYCIHRFWPRCAIGGIVRLGTNVVELEGSRGVFIHAIQGMRPDNLAAKWNFANFQSPAADGVSLVQMEFTTTKSHGSQKVNIGSVVVGDKLVAVTAGGDGVEGKSTASYLSTVTDADTKYNLPGSIKWNWDGVTVFDESPANVGGQTKAELTLDLATGGANYETRGLIEKVDVLGQLPWAVKKIVNATGTKPYIYTWLNEVTAKVSTPAEKGAEPKEVEVKGLVFNEASFVSNN